MPTIKTEDLTGRALDAAVALALGYKLAPDSGLLGFTSWVTPERVQLQHLFEPSTNPSQGAPLIWERKIATFASGDAWCAVDPDEGRKMSSYSVQSGYIDTNDSSGETMRGPTALVAGCRVLVSMALGDTVDVPEGLA